VGFLPAIDGDEEAIVRKRATSLPPTTVKTLTIGKRARSHELTTVKVRIVGALCRGTCPRLVPRDR
jgi:hypothetical protein